MILCAMAWAWSLAEDYTRWQETSEAPKSGETSEVWYIGQFSMLRISCILCRDIDFGDECLVRDGRADISAFLLARW